MAFPSYSQPDDDDQNGDERRRSEDFSDRDMMQGKPCNNTIN
jgi:hypothetical protein